MISPALNSLSRPNHRQFVHLLAATIIAIYAVLATGATAASTSTGRCSNWTVCAETVGTLVPGSGLFVLGHQLLTALAGLLLCLTLVVAWRIDVSRAVRGLVVVGCALFPLQVVLGGLLATGYVGVTSQVHLLVAVVIFGLLLVALGWTLEGRPAGTQALNPASQVEQTTTTAETTTATAELTTATTESTAEPTETTTTTAEPTTTTEFTTETAETATETGADGGAQSTATGMDQGWTATARAYLELTKPRLMWLLCLLALAGMALATTTGLQPSGVTVVATLAGGVLAIGASGTFNHVAERERDRKMERTADRPVATDQVPRRNAAAFGVFLCCLSMGVMFVLVNTVATLLTLVAIIYYSVIYTIVLKPNTSWNIAIGGGAGALPAVIGWAAVTGSVGLPALVLAGLVVVWTPAHFYNLAIVYRDDYARAGYPMYPVVSGIPAARRRILAMLGVTLLVTVLLVLVTPLGWLFALSTVLVGAVFLSALVTQCQRRTDSATMRTFHASNAYLGVVLLAIVVEALILL